MTVEVAVLGSPSRIVLMVSVEDDVGLHVLGCLVDISVEKATMKFNSVQAEFAAEIPTGLKGANDRLNQTQNSSL